MNQLSKHHHSLVLSAICYRASLMDSSSDRAFVALFTFSTAWGFDSRGVLAHTAAGRIIAADFSAVPADSLLQTEVAQWLA